MAGSDGYVYEGRGWHRQGAHTLGHNANGYGVAFIGDYAAELPSRRSMGLVRDRLASCAVGGGRLVANYTLQGHRQVVSTSCPGDALYSEITRWEHWGVGRTREPGFCIWPLGGACCNETGVCFRRPRRRKSEEALSCCRCCFSSGHIELIPAQHQ